MSSEAPCHDVVLDDDQLDVAVARFRMIADLTRRALGAG